MKSKTIAIILAISMILASCSSVPQKNMNKKREVESLIQETLDQTGISGLAASVIYNGEVLISQGFGYSDGKKAQIPVSENTLFQIGSITKILTALAIMDLVEEGKINLDADIRQYLKNFNPRTDLVTDGSISVRNLLTHHSGLPSSFLKDFLLDKPESDRFMNTSAQLSEEFMVWESGKTWAYNNSGFSLLGELIATVSGMTYEEYIKQRIFRPIDLTDAQVYLSDLNHPGVSGGFTAGESTDLMIIKDLPAGSVLFSAEHMTLFMKELLDCNMGKSQKILETETLRSMFDSQNSHIAIDDAFDMGLTFWIDSYKGKKTVGHGGTIPPFYSEMKLVPEEGIGIFLNSNDNLGNNELLHKLEKGILNILIDGQEDNFQEMDSTVSNDISMSDYEGYYTVGSFGLFELSIRDDVLTANLPQMGINSPIIIQPDHSLLIRDLGILLVPTDVNGADFFCYKEDFFLGPVLSIAGEPVPPIWMERTGHYVSDNFVHGIMLSSNQNSEFLTLDVEVMGGLLPLALTVKSPSLLQIQGMGRNQGNIVEYSKNENGQFIKYAGIIFTKEN